MYINIVIIYKFKIKWIVVGCRRRRKANLEDFIWISYKMKIKEWINKLFDDLNKILCYVKEWFNKIFYSLIFFEIIFVYLYSEIYSFIVLVLKLFFSNLFLILSIGFFLFFG